DTLSLHDALPISKGTCVELAVPLNLWSRKPPLSRCSRSWRVNSIRPTEKETVMSTNVASETKIPSEGLHAQDELIKKLDAAGPWIIHVGDAFVRGMRDIG